MADSHEYRRKFFLGNIVFLCVLFLILVAVFFLRDLLGSAKADLTSDKVYTISPQTKKILGSLIDDITVTYYVSADSSMPARLQTLKRDTKDLFDEFYDLSNQRFQYTIINPDEEANESAEKKVAEYLEKKKDGKTLEEPEPPPTIQDIFAQKPKKKPEDIRAEREQKAATVAAQQQRSKDDVYKDLLRDDFKRQHLQKLEQEGVQPVIWPERDASSVRQLKVFSAMSIKYLKKEPETIGFHYQIENLEYELASRIVKLTTNEKALVAFFDGKKPPAPPMNPMNPTPPPQSDYEAIINFFNEQSFEVSQVELKEGNSLDDLVKRKKEDRWRKANEDKDEAEKKDPPADVKEVKTEDLPRFIKCFVVAQPDNLEPRQIYEINRAVAAGVNTIFLVSPWSADVSRQGSAQGLPVEGLNPSLGDLFKKWGIELRDEVLASNDAGKLEVLSSIQGMRVAMVRELSFCVLASQESQSLDQSSAITNRVEHIVFPTTPGFKLSADVLKKNGLESQVLAKTSKESWSVKVNPFDRLSDPFQKQKGMGWSIAQYQKDLAMAKNPDEFRDFIDPTPLAVLVRGKLPFTFEGETIPDWKKEEKKDDKGKKLNPHAGIPGLQGIPGLEPPDEGDNDLLLNAADPQDAKDSKAPAAGAAPKPAPAPTLPPAPPPAAGAGATSNAPAAQPTAPAALPLTPPGQPSPGTPPPAPGTPQPAPGAAPAPSPDGKVEPAKPVERPKASQTPVEGQVLFLASVDMLKNDFLLQGQGNNDFRPNAGFLQNALELFGLGQDLIDIRRKQLTVRSFKPGSDKHSTFITWLNILGVPALVAIAGLVYYCIRRADSNAYERRIIQRQS